jgi:NADH-quinone oxidoreductase subunit L
MTRVMLMTFFGEERWRNRPTRSPEAPSAEPAAEHRGEHAEPHPHESPKVMTIPMIVLAFGSVFAGGFFSIGDRFLHWLEPVTGHSEGDSPLSAATVTGATMVCLLIGVAIAWAQYGRKPVPAVAPRGSLLTRAARRDLLQDDFNHVVLVRGGEHLTRSLVYVDHTLVDGVVNGTAASVGGLSGRLRRLQNGFARSYAVSMFGGAALLIAATLLMRAV